MEELKPVLHGVEWVPREIDERMKIVEVKHSEDGLTTKFTQRTSDNHQIETAYVDYSNKHIICYSTQVGCNYRCIMCYNGRQHNFSRNLYSSEIIAQVNNVIHHMYLGQNKPILFTAMGIGEPLANYDAFIDAIHSLNEQHPDSKFAVSTCGAYPNRIIDLIRDTADLNFKLTVSLHAALSVIREQMMPCTAPIEYLMEHVNQYQRALNREVEYNVTLIEGLNDRAVDAKAIHSLIKHRGIPEMTTIKVNRFNPIPGCSLQGSTKVDKFVKLLSDLGTKVEYYETNGSDIGAACGQMIKQ